MIIVDSSIWIHFFNQPTLQATSLDFILKTKADIAIIELILTEVLAGFHKAKDFYQARKIFEKIKILPFKRSTYIDSAHLYQTLRKKGLTIRGIIDCLIAQACIEHSAELLTLDKDFQKIAFHSKLKILSIADLLH